MRTRCAFLVLSLLAASVLLGGCSSGPRLYRVAGHVTFDGAPVENGEIILVSVEPGTAPDAGPIKDGAFSLMAKAGPKKIEIRASRAVAQTAMGPLMKEYVPRRYNADSELREEVQPNDTNDFTFELTSVTKKAGTK